jgi:hypothetical protein
LHVGLCFPELVFLLLLFPADCVLPAATELFEATGSGADAALLNTVIIGAVNVASTVVAILVVDRWVGRGVLTGVSAHQGSASRVAAVHETGA